MFVQGIGFSSDIQFVCRDTQFEYWGVEFDIHADCGFGYNRFGYRGIQFEYWGAELVIHAEGGFGGAGLGYWCFRFVRRCFKNDDHAVCGYRDSGFVYRGIQCDACWDGGYWGGGVFSRLGRPGLLFEGVFRCQGALALAGHSAFLPGP